MGRAAIVYDRPRWADGRRAALAGALLAAVVILMWLASMGMGTSPFERSPPVVKTASARTPVVDPAMPFSPPALSPPLPTAPPRSVTSPPPVAEPPAAPYRYAGHWRQGRHTEVVLSAAGYSLVVRVPGPLDDRFDVVSIDDHRVLLKDRQSLESFALPLSGSSAQRSRDAAKVAPRATAEAADTPPPNGGAERVASPPAVPVVQLGGDNRGDAESEN